MNISRGPGDGAVDALLGQQDQSLDTVRFTKRQQGGLDLIMVAHRNPTTEDDDIVRGDELAQGVDGTLKIIPAMRDLGFLDAELAQPSAKPGTALSARPAARERAAISFMWHSDLGSRLIERGSMNPR